MDNFVNTSLGHVQKRIFSSKKYIYFISKKKKNVHIKISLWNRYDTITYHGVTVVVAVMTLT